MRVHGSFNKGYYSPRLFTQIRIFIPIFLKHNFSKYLNAIRSKIWDKVIYILDIWIIGARHTHQDG
jgi:hypothetical protein